MARRRVIRSDSDDAIESADEAVCIHCEEEGGDMYRCALILYIYTAASSASSRPYIMANCALVFLGMDINKDRFFAIDGFRALAIIFF
jgi:hypothetical protein